MSDSIPETGLPYDEAEFLNRLDGDLELSDEITQLFLETCPRSIAELQETLSQGDLYTLGRLAHGIKGSVGVFAAEACFEAALALESACRGGEFGPAQEDCVRLRLEIQRLSAALAERVGGRTACES